MDDANKTTTPGLLSRFVYETLAGLAVVLVLVLVFNWHGIFAGVAGFLAGPLLVPAVRAFWRRRPT